jgi:hypothetical protein
MNKLQLGDIYYDQGNLYYVSAYQPPKTRKGQLPAYPLAKGSIRRVLGSNSTFIKHVVDKVPLGEPYSGYEERTSSLYLIDFENLMLGKPQPLLIDLYGDNVNCIVRATNNFTIIGEYLGSP